MQIPGIWPIPYVLVSDRLIVPERHRVTVRSLLRAELPKSRGSQAITTPPLERGIYNFAPTECSTRDIFGLFEHTGTFAIRADVQRLPADRWRSAIGSS